MELFQLPTGSYRTRAALAFRGGRFSDQRDFAATAVLVRHPAGDVLIDAGFGAHAEEHIGMLASFRRSAHTLGTPVAAQLDAAGYDRGRLRGVILTHSHWDHVSGLADLDVPIITTAAEREYAAKNAGDRVFERVSANREFQEYSFDGPEYLGFAVSHDFYGDGSLVIVPAAGHTSGSVIVFVTVPAGTRYAFIGDLVWQLDGVTRGVDRPWLLRTMADSDAAQIRRDLARIVGLADRVQVVPAHDARGYDGIPPLVPQAPRSDAGVPA
jgi:glyoxylase-like metal-dependent hydrolase (beta-lactamase superfamily II)